MDQLCNTGTSVVNKTQGRVLDKLMVIWYAFGKSSNIRKVKQKYG